MSVSLKKILGSAVASSVCALAFAGAANALEAGECYNKSEALNQMASEGQMPVVVAYRRAGMGTKKNIFYSDENGEGYLAEFDGNKLCIDLELSGVRLYDYRQGKAQNTVDRSGLEFDTASSNGRYPVLQANGYNRDGGGYFTLFSAKDGSTGLMTLSTNSYGTQGDDTFVSINFTSEGNYIVSVSVSVSVSVAAKPK